MSDSPDPRQDEVLIPIKQARRLFATQPTCKTIQTWYLDGLLGPDGNRVYLRVVREGGRVHTTQEAAQEFRSALNGW